MFRKQGFTTAFLGLALAISAHAEFAPQPGNAGNQNFNNANANANQNFQNGLAANQAANAAIAQNNMAAQERAALQRQIREVARRITQAQAALKQLQQAKQTAVVEFPISMRAMISGILLNSGAQNALALNDARNEHQIVQHAFELVQQGAFENLIKQANQADLQQATTELTTFSQNLEKLKTEAVNRVAAQKTTAYPRQGTGLAQREAFAQNAATIIGPNAYLLGTDIGLFVMATPQDTPPRAMELAAGAPHEEAQ